MNSRKLFISFFLLIGMAALLLAQQPAAILDYFENNSGGLRLVTLDGEEYYAEDIGFGGELPVGGTLVTEDGDYVEIRLDPNGSIIRVSENTNFSIDGLQGRDGSPSNAFSVAVGKFRAVVARSDTASYTFTGQSAVCGVRGTDFGMSVLPGVSESVFVLDGLVDYTNAAGNTIEVAAGTMADALSEVFQAVTLSADALAGFLSGLEFQSLQKSAVPGYEEVSVPPTEPEAAPEEEAVKEAREGYLARLMQLLGMEIGSVTIGGDTYAKAIIQPRFALGKLKIALYLPIIYTGNMLDPVNDWYKPEGNNEWSFGTDQEGWDQIALDLLEDLFLKIRYIQYGEQRDPFFFKFGNLNNITVGHGTIMRNYANDADFPAVRKLGFNLGADAAKVGFEAMVNDAADPEIFGARLYFRPFGATFPLAIGLTGITDIEPDQTGDFGRPILLNGGFDLDFPFIETDPLSVIMFADIAGMVPYFRKDILGIKSGLRTEAIWDGSRLRNWGFATGFLGNIMPIDYRLEFRYSTGTFIPAFYNSIYERKRSEYVVDIVNYLEYPDDPAFNTRTMGIYGEAGFTMEKVFFIEAGYLWPWYIGNTGGGQHPDDFFHFKVGIPKGLLPLYASISYDRTALVTSALNGEDFVLFNDDTVLTAEVAYPVAAVLELAVLVVNNFVEGASHISVSILTRANY